MVLASAPTEFGSLYLSARTSVKEKQRLGCSYLSAQTRLSALQPRLLFFGRRVILALAAIQTARGTLLGAEGTAGRIVQGLGVTTAAGGSFHGCRIA